MKKIRIGQIGIGHNHGEAKMLAIRKFPELFEVVGIAEEDPVWMEQRGNLPGYDGLPRLSVDELLSKCDAILVEGAVPELTRIAQRCVDAGKHIHMDKPGSGTLEEFKRVMDTAKEKQLVVQMGYMYRYNPAIRKTIQAVQEGKLGEIFSINAEMSTYHNPGYKRWLSTFQGGIQYILVILTFVKLGMLGENVIMFFSLLTSPVTPIPIPKKRFLSKLSISSAVPFSKTLTMVLPDFRPITPCWLHCTIPFS